MKSILNDIELDFVELKYFLEYVEKNPNDKKLQEVASRALTNLSLRVESLKKSFNSSISQTEIPDPVTIAVVNQPVVAKTVIVEEEYVHAPFGTDFSEDSEDLNIVPEVSVGIDSSLVESEIKEPLKNEVVESSIENCIEETAKQTVEAPVEAKSENLPLKIAGLLYKSLTLNDVFFYTRELFKGDSNALKSGMSQLETLSTYEQAYRFSIDNLGLDKDIAAFESFDEFLKRNFKA